MWTKSGIAFAPHVILTSSLPRDFRIAPPVYFRHFPFYNERTLRLVDFSAADIHSEVVYSLCKKLELKDGYHMVVFNSLHRRHTANIVVLALRLHSFSSITKKYGSSCHKAELDQKYFNCNSTLKRHILRSIQNILCNRWLSKKSWIRCLAVKFIIYISDNGIS